MDGVKPHRATSTGNYEWFTPPKYIDAARKVMGSIDLDPASCELANSIVKADHYYTENTNGLAHQWFGNVWLNPPYSKELIGPFCEKLAHSHFMGDIQQSITLVNNSTETTWFKRLTKTSTAICFPSSRIRFNDQEGNPQGSPLQGQAFIYHGPNTVEFSEEFSQFGLIVLPIPEWYT